MRETTPSVRDVTAPIIRRVEDRPPAYMLEAYREMARTAGVDPRAFCALHFEAFPNEITREACEALIRELKLRIAGIHPSERAANEAAQERD